MAGTFCALAMSVSGSRVHEGIMQTEIDWRIRKEPNIAEKFEENTTEAIERCFKFLCSQVQNCLEKYGDYAYRSMWDYFCDNYSFDSELKLSNEQVKALFVMGYLGCCPIEVRVLEENGYSLDRLIEIYEYLQEENVSGKRFDEKSPDIIQLRDIKAGADCI